MRQTPASNPAADAPKTVANIKVGQPTEYICPMDPEVHEKHPGACPICGMALEPAQIAMSSTRTEYTCPMHPEIVRSSLERAQSAAWRWSREMAVEEINPELVDMRQRFWISRTTIPLAGVMVDVLSSASACWPAWAGSSLWLEFAFHSSRALVRLALSLNAPGFGRNRHLNMFTLISSVSASAYLYSLRPSVWENHFRLRSGRQTVGGSISSPRPSSRLWSCLVRPWN